MVFEAQTREPLKMHVFTESNSRLHQIFIAFSFCALVFAAWHFVPHPGIVILISLIPLAIIFTLKKPLIMVTLFVVFSFFRIHEAIEVLMPLRLPQLLSLAALAGLGWGLFITKSIKPWWSKEMSYLVTFFSLVTIGLVFTPSKDVAITFFTSVYWKVVLMTFAIAWLIRKKSDFKFISTTIMLGGLIIGTKALYNKVNEIGLVEGTRVTIGRDFGSILGDPNDLSLVLMFPMAFAIANLLSDKVSYLWRFFSLLLVILLFSAVIATQSRGGLLGIMAVFGVFFYQRVKNKLLFFSLGAVAAAVLYVAAGISGRQSGGAHEEGIDESAAGRLYAWEAAISMAIHKPLTGVGVSSFYYNYFDHSNYWDGKPHAVHSTWFGVLAETGILGFWVFMAFIISLGKKAYRTRELAKQHFDKLGLEIHIISQAAFAGFLGTAATATFLTHGFSWPFYIFGALIMAADHMVKNILQKPA